MEVIHLLRFVRNNCPYNAEQKCMKRYILYRRLPLIGISGTVWSVMHVLSLGVVCMQMYAMYVCPQIFVVANATVVFVCLCLYSMYRVFFSLVPPYGKPRLGESTLTKISQDTPKTQPRFTFLYLCAAVCFLCFCAQFLYACVLSCVFECLSALMCVSVLVSLSFPQLQTTSGLISTGLVCLCTLLCV